MYIYTQTGKGFAPTIPFRRISATITETTSFGTGERAITFVVPSAVYPQF